MTGAIGWRTLAWCLTCRMVGQSAPTTTGRLTAHEETRRHLRNLRHNAVTGVTTWAMP